MKPYTWEEIKDFLTKELKKTKHILTFGTIGSLNIERDIDVIITKKANSTLKEFYKEVHNLFDNINSFLKINYNARAIRFNLNEPEALELAKFEKNDLAFHVMIYTTFSQLEYDWHWYLSKNKTLQDLLIKEYKIILGNPRDIFSSKFNKKTYAEIVSFYLYQYDRINSGYDERLLIKIMNFYFNFIFRKQLNLNPPINKNKKQVRENFYKLCAEIDKLENK